jgi:hypothetical protein
MYMEEDINGKYRRREPLLRYPIDAIESADYNEILARLITDKQTDNIDAIRAISDFRVRAVAAMLYADLSVRDIARVLRQTARNIYRMIDVYK